MSLSSGFNARMETLVGKVHKEDVNDRRILIYNALMFVLFGINNVILALDKYAENPHGLGYLGNVSFSLSVLCVLPYLIYKLFQNWRIRYDVPVDKFFSDVEKRYALFHLDTLFLIPVVLLLDVAVIFWFYEPLYPLVWTIVLVQLGLLIVFGAAFTFGVKVWRMRKKPIIEDIRCMREEMLHI